MPAKAESGEAKAAQEVRLLLKCRPILIGYIRNMAGHTELAEEIFQDVCVAALEAVQESKAGRREPLADPMAWARGTARNLLRGKYRRDRRLVFLDCPELDEALERLYEKYDRPTEATRMMDRLRLLHECLGRFGEQQRELLRLRYSLGRPLAEIGRLFAKSEDAVRMALARLRQKLTDCLQKKSAAEESEA